MWLPNPFISSNLRRGRIRIRRFADDVSGGSVKEELSAIGAVEAFLAPPLPLRRQASSFSSSAAVTDDTGGSMSPTFSKIRSEVAEIGVSIKSSLSLFSNNMVVADLSKTASNFLQLNEADEDQDDRGVGIDY